MIDHEVDRVLRNTLTRKSLCYVRSVISTALSPSHFRHALYFEGVTIYFTFNRHLQAALNLSGLVQFDGLLVAGLVQLIQLAVCIQGIPALLAIGHHCALDGMGLDLFGAAVTICSR